MLRVECSPCAWFDFCCRQSCMRVAMDALIIQSMAGFVFLGVDVGEEPPEPAVVGARPLEVQQVAGLRDALQVALLAQLPANASSGFGEFSPVIGISAEGGRWMRGDAGRRRAGCLHFHLPGQLYVEELVLLAPDQHYLLQPRQELGYFSVQNNFMFFMENPKLKSKGFSFQRKKESCISFSKREKNGALDCLSCSR